MGNSPPSPRVSLGPDLPASRGRPCPVAPLYEMLVPLFTPALQMPRGVGRQPCEAEGRTGLRAVSLGSGGTAPVGPRLGRGQVFPRARAGRRPGPCCPCAGNAPAHEHGWLPRPAGPHRHHALRGRCLGFASRQPWGGKSPRRCRWRRAGSCWKQVTARWGFTSRACIFASISNFPREKVEQNLAFPSVLF